KTPRAELFPLVAKIAPLFWLEVLKTHREQTSGVLGYNKLQKCERGHVCSPAWKPDTTRKGAGAMDKIMEPLQRRGKALMGAVAVMPLAALMMGIGYWISSVGGDNTVIFGDLLLKTGAAVLDNLGVIFAIAIAYGLSR